MTISVKISVFTFILCAALTAACSSTTTSSSSSSGGGGGDGGAGADGGLFGGGGGGDGGGGGTTSIVAEVEPNDGPAITGAQSLGAVTGTTTFIINGTLSTGGFEGAKYTGTTISSCSMRSRPARST